MLFLWTVKNTQMILNKKLNIILLENLQTDAELAIKELKTFIKEFNYKVTDNKKEYIKALKEFKPHLVISNIKLPEFTGMEAFEMKNMTLPDIPFIILTHTADEETAIAYLQKGVDSYILKNHIKQLGPAAIGSITKKDNEVKHRKTVNELKISEGINRSITESAPDAIILVNSKGEVVTWNKSSEKMFGYSSKEMTGRSILKVIPESLASDHKSHFSKFSKGETLPIIGKTTEVRAIKKDKTEIPVELSMAKWRKDDELFITAIVREISERKKAENIQSISFNLANKANTTNDIVEFFSFIRNELSKIIDTTNFFIALYNKEDNSLHLPFIADSLQNGNYFPAENTLSKYVIDKKISLLADKNTIENLVKKGFIKIIGAKAVSWLGVPLIVDNEAIGVIAVQSYDNNIIYTKENQNFLEFVSSQISLTVNRKKKEEDLKIALEKAQEADKLKSAFLQNISHEIRTPMNGILGFTSLLNDPNLSKKEIESYINIINISGKRMLNTLSDLMEISRLDAGVISVNKNNVNINWELDELFEFYQNEVNKKELKFELQKGLPDDSCIIETDKSKILAILRNLLKNAIKYTSEGNIKFGYISGKSEIKFFVIDTGIGIHKDKQKSIFERFVQADLKDIKVHEGTGLGLSIAKAYIELMGGHIWLISQQNKGSEFYFTIPHKATKTPVVKELSDAPKKKFTVLIAEDEEVTDNLLTIILNDYCDVILHAKNGEEAVNMAKSNKNIDVILMDMKMPRLNGYKATKIIREFDKDTYIIAQTAYALSGDREKAINAGCNDYITKPINNELLVEKIKAIKNS